MGNKKQLSMTNNVTMKKKTIDKHLYIFYNYIYLFIMFSINRSSNLVRKLIKYNINIEIFFLFQFIIIIDHLYL
jgi:hypothetical protein